MRRAAEDPDSELPFRDPFSSQAEAEQQEADKQTREFDSQVLLTPASEPEASQSALSLRELPPSQEGSLLATMKKPAANTKGSKAEAQPKSVAKKPGSKAKAQPKSLAKKPASKTKAQPKSPARSKAKARPKTARKPRNQAQKN